MSDQAQGLRELADQSRRDPGGHSPAAFAPADSFAAATASRTLETERAVLPLSPVAAPHYAVADARLHNASLTETTRPVRARVLAVTSGKGGVGKTNFSTGLALTLAQQGKRVIVLDADLGLANLHVVLGINPRYHLEHVLRGEKTLRETLFPGPLGIQIIGGASGLTELANLTKAQREHFIASLQELDTLADVIIIDTGAGLSHTVLSFLNATEEILVVTTPEPTAITDAYATIKVVTGENPGARLRLVVNMAQSQEEAFAVANRLNQIAQQFLHTRLDFAGYIPLDPAVRAAVRAQKPFVLTHPHSPAARGIAQIAASLNAETEKAPEKSAPAERGGITGLLNRMQARLGFAARR